MPSNTGYRKGGLEYIHAFLEIKVLEVFHRCYERFDIKIIISLEEVTKHGHLLLAPDVLIVGVILLRDVCPLQLTVEGFVWRETDGFQVGNVVKPFVRETAFLFRDMAGLEGPSIRRSRSQELAYVQELEGLCGDARVPLFFLITNALESSGMFRCLTKTRLTKPKSYLAELNPRTGTWEM